FRWISIHNGRTILLLNANITLLWINYIANHAVTSVGTISITNSILRDYLTCFRIKYWTMFWTVSTSGQSLVRAASNEGKRGDNRKDWWTLTWLDAGMIGFGGKDVAFDAETSWNGYLGTKSRLSVVNFTRFWIEKGTDGWASGANGEHLMGRTFLVSG